MIIINPDTRQFNVPGAELVFGVESDAGSERKWFQCPRYVGDNIDLAACFVRMNYRNANGEMDSYLVDDVTIKGDNVEFSWVLSQKAVRYKGQVKFVVCVVGPNQKVEWHTTLGTGMVLEGLEPDTGMVESNTADVVAQLIAMVEAQTAAVEKVGAEQIAEVKAAAKAAEAASVAEIEAKGVNTRESIPADYTALSEAVGGLTKGCAGVIVCEAEGSVIAVSDASELPMQGMRIFGRSTQDGTPTPEVPVEIVSIENPTVSVGEQTLGIPRTLPGIPVTSGGNYTDSDGQQWICDEVDLERGVYVRRIKHIILDGSESWKVASSKYIYMKTTDYATKPGRGLCSCVPYKYSYEGDGIFAIDNVIYLGEELSRSFNLDTTEWVNILAANPATILYTLANPIETPLSETEIAAYRALHTNKPNTTILNDSGAHMAVAYAADTKLYIDNKIAALTARV